MKKLALTIVAVMLMSVFSTVSLSAISFSPQTFTINSEAAYLVNLDTGTVIYEKNADKRLYPASLTKVMTAILVLENISDLENTMIEALSYIFDELYGQNASTADFRPYETASAEDLLYGLMLQSACEAGSILGHHVGGSVENFVLMMNDKAKELGCENTNFVNAHGLHDDNQYTTASDMAKIMEYAVSLPKFTEIASTYSYEVGPSNKHSEPRSLYNTNKMLLKSSDYYYEPLRASKTGTTDEAGRCLASTASLDGYNYLLVTMHGDLYDADGNVYQSGFEDAKLLYDWAFTNFRQTKLLAQNEEIDEVAVQYAEDGADYVLVHSAEEFSMLWPTQIDPSTIIRDTELPQMIDAPVKKGDVIGKLTLKVGGEELFTTDLIAANDVERSALKYNLAVAKEFFSSFWFKLAVGIVIVLIVAYIFIWATVARKKRRMMKRVNKKRKF